MFDNHLLKHYLTNDDDGEIKIKIEKTYKACNINIDVSKQSLLNEFEVLVDSFTVSFYDYFDKVFLPKTRQFFDILAKYIGTKIQSCLIECGDASFLSQRAAFRCSVTNEMFSPLTLIIEERHKDIYLKRMIRDLNDDYVSDVFVNINLGRYM
ncbi:unnamed protein product [Mytilus edulis]|uniref:Uncharacterized protein n=1 Tax=Mytilus edulis TaxID=6550 RepID=A0A8S3QEV8_MYTED|nr:unnamed protein product [Mytilus edulis]